MIALTTLAGTAAYAAALPLGRSFAAWFAIIAAAAVSVIAFG